MLLTQIDHVAIAVHDLEAAIAYYRAASVPRSTTAKWWNATG